MNKTPLKLLGTLLLGITLVSSALAAESDALQGKWKADKEMNGSKVSVSLEITKDQFVYVIKDGTGDTRLFVKGKFKLEQQGAFKTFTVQDMQGGASKDDLKPVDETRAFVYITGWKSLTLAANFDRQRDNEQPELTSYRKE
jgi:hypothetical protein